MNLTEEQYLRYKNYCNIIAENKQEAEDLLHDVLIKLHIKNMEDSKINDNHVFIIIKNHFLNNKSKEKVRKKIRGHSLEFIDDIYKTVEIDIHDLKIKDDFLQDKLNLIERVINKLPSYEKKLFILHFIKGIPQRKISRETGIGTMPIFYKINKIKNLIISTWHEEENQKNK